MPKPWITLALMAAIAASLGIFNRNPHPGHSRHHFFGGGSKDLRRKLLRVPRRQWSRSAWRISAACGQSDGDGFARYGDRCAKKWSYRRNDR
jgi:hypothetical protein